MHEDNMAIVKSLVSVAWADGVYAEEEREMLEALIAAFEANEEEAKSIREYASTKRTLDDIPLSDLSIDDRRVLVQHAVLLTYVDGTQAPEEKEFLGKLCTRLRIPDAEATTLMAAAEQHAKKFLNLL
jgi:tellurite resistance protein